VRTLLTGYSPATSVPLTSLVLDPNAFDFSSILVRYRTEAMTGAASSHAAWGGDDAAVLPLVPGLLEVNLPAGSEFETVLASYRANPMVLYAQPNYRVHAAVLPNDPGFQFTWGLHNTGQTGGTDDADIDAVEAWDTTQGSGDTIVAVIDTGVDYNHPDLAANIWSNTDEIAGNGQDDDNNGYVDDVRGYDFVDNDPDPMDDNGHGTHVSGTIGAVGDNGIGVAGVNWNVQIMPLKFLSAGGSGNISDAIRALNYAVANGATISSNSWGYGGGGFDQALYDAIRNAGNAGHIFVAAAGNDGADNDEANFYPASFDLDNIIAVAATDHNDALASFSNTGATTVDLAAPGLDIYSTMPANSYGTLSGTSMATPHVAGVVGLVRDLHPTWTYSQVINQVLGTVDTVSGLAGKVVTGGRLNAAAAATGTPPPDTKGPRVVSSSPAGTVSGSVSSVQFTFNESIADGTFTVQDIQSFTGPGGVDLISRIGGVSGSGKDFTIQFTEQTEFGSYSLVIGPDILDQAASPNAMNQDRDATNGEIPDDQFSASFNISDAFIFSSLDVPQPISDFTQTVSSLTIDQDVTINDLDIQLNITHTYDWDMLIRLYSPEGDIVVLSDQRGDSGNDFLDTVFDDEASGSIADGSAPFAGSFRPETELSALDGKNARGTWQLWIDDVGWLDLGSFNSWSLRILPGAAVPPPPPPANNPPDAMNDSERTDLNSPVTLSVLANDSDPDNDPLSVTGIGTETNGLALINADNSVTFTPDTDFVGTGGFSYTISDGRGGTDTATVTVFVGLTGNLPPDAVDDSLEMYEDSMPFIDVLANDTDPDGDPLQIVSVDNILNGTVISYFGMGVAFQPDMNYFGPAGFTYTIADGFGGFDTATVTIDVLPVNDLPDAADDWVSGDEDSPLTIEVLTNDSDPDGDPISIDTIDFVQFGTAEINPDNTITFNPDADFFGWATLGYTISDGQGGSDSAMVLVEIAPVNDAPIAVDDQAVGAKDTPIVFNGVSGNPPAPHANDTDVDGDWLSIIAVGNAVHGTVSMGSPGNVTFTPEAGYVGSASFEYTISDGSLSDTGRVDIEILSYTYLSTTIGGTLTNSNGSTLSFSDADILRLVVDGAGKFTYSMYFDGSDVGLTQSSEDIDAFTFLADGSILVSTVGSFSVPVTGSPPITGMGEDLLQFWPSALGATTAGSWSLYFDGSDVGLSGTSENVDSVAVLPNGRILISTAAGVFVPGVTGGDVDLLQFAPFSLGSSTSGTWSIYFDGSDVSLSDNSSEDVDALFVKASTVPGGMPSLSFSTRGSFSVPGVSGANEDAVTFLPTTLGSTTSGTYRSALAFDGSLYALAPFDLDGIHSGLPPSWNTGGMSPGLLAAGIAGDPASVPAVTHRSPRATRETPFVDSSQGQRSAGEVHREQTVDSVVALRRTSAVQADDTSRAVSQSSRFIRVLDVLLSSVKQRTTSLDIDEWLSIASDWQGGLPV